MKLGIEAISEEILKDLSDGLSISDELLQGYLRETVSEIKSDFPHDEELFESEELSDAELLIRDMFDIYTLKLASRYESDDALRIGVCYGISQVADEYRREALADRADAELEQRARNNETIRSLFYIVDRHPNLTFTEISGRLGVDKSRVSQIVRELAPNKVLSITQMGRTKHVSLSRKGKDLVKKLKADEAVELRKNSNAEMQTNIDKTLIFEKYLEVFKKMNNHSDEEPVRQIKQTSQNVRSGKGWPSSAQLLSINN